MGNPALVNVPNNGQPTRAEMQARIDGLEAQAAAGRAFIDKEQDKIANLERALITARQIGAAVGILMAQEHLTAEQAFDRLTTASQHTNRKLREIAEDVIRTGTID